MLDLSILMKQHTQIGEGLAAFQMLTSHLPGAVTVSSTKDHNLCFGVADGEAIGGTERLHGVRPLLQSLCRCREQCNVIGIKQAGNAGASTHIPADGQSDWQSEVSWHRPVSLLMDTSTCADARMVCAARYAHSKPGLATTTRLRHLVKPILCYGCDVWAIVGNKTDIDELERIQQGFMKRLLECRRRPQICMCLPSLEDSLHSFHGRPWQENI